MASSVVVRGHNGPHCFLGLAFRYYHIDAPVSTTIYRFLMSTTRPEAVFARVRLKAFYSWSHVVGTSGGPDSCLIEVLWNSWRDDTLTSDIRPGVAKAGGSKQHVVGMTFLDKKVVERLFGDSRMFSARDIPRHASGIPRTIVEMCRA